MGRLVSHLSKSILILGLACLLFLFAISSFISAGSRPVGASGDGVQTTPTVTMTSTVTVTATTGVFLSVMRLDPTLTPTPSPTPTATPAGYPPDDEERENDVIALINQERAASGVGLNPLNVDGQLVQSARRHSTDMATNNNTSHTGSDGTSPKQRIEAAGYNPVWNGEIIAWGFPDAAGAFNWWMNSTTHRNMILSVEFEDFGVGYGASNANFRHYWVVNFGRRSGEPDHNVVRCTVSTGTAERGASATFWTAAPCP